MPVQTRYRPGMPGRYRDRASSSIDRGNLVLGQAQKDFRVSQIKSPKIVLPAWDHGLPPELIKSPFVANIGTSFEFSTLVPEKTNFQLDVASPVLALADTSGKQLAHNAFKESLVSPALTENPVELSPLGRPVAPRMPSRLFSFVATGLVAP